jgi:DNA-binding LacI/PurR family transcriptional regulator
VGYQLTSFRQDPQTMAATTMMLLDRRQGELDQPPARERLIAPLVVRGSFVPSGLG